VFTRHTTCLLILFSQPFSLHHDHTRTRTRTTERACTGGAAVCRPCLPNLPRALRRPYKAIASPRHYSCGRTPGRPFLGSGARDWGENSILRIWLNSHRRAVFTQSCLGFGWATDVGAGEGTAPLATSPLRLDQSTLTAGPSPPLPVLDVVLTALINPPSPTPGRP
jgi:hypothetical protein